MAKIVKLKQDGVQIYPQTITDAIADIKRGDVLSNILDDIEGRLDAIEAFIGSGSSTEFIDNLRELMDFFKGTGDKPVFQDVIKEFVNAVNADDIETTTDIDEGGDFADYDDILS